MVALKVFEVVVAFCIAASYSYNSVKAGAVSTKRECENNNFRFRCFRSTVVKINGATYGRKCCPDLCPRIVGGMESNLNCGLENNVIKIVQETCDGKAICEFPVTNKFLGPDPCRGTMKYIEVVSTCVSPPRELSESTNNVTSTATTLLVND